MICSVLSALHTRFISSAVTLTNACCLVRVQVYKLLCVQIQWPFWSVACCCEWRLLHLIECLVTRPSTGGKKKQPKIRDVVRYKLLNGFCVLSRTSKTKTICMQILSSLDCLIFCKVYLLLHLYKEHPELHDCLWRGNFWETYSKWSILCHILWHLSLHWRIYYGKISWSTAVWIIIETGPISVICVNSST